MKSLIKENRNKSIDKDILKKTVAAIDEKNGGFSLQKKLNEISKDKKEIVPLKLDNDIAEKTTSVFNLLKDDKEDEISSIFKPQKPLYESLIK